MRWNELSPLVTGHQVRLTLSDGSAASGEAVAIRDDGILLDVSVATKAHPKGSGSIPRNSIVLVDLQRTRGSLGRTLGTVFGTLGGLLLAGWIDSRNTSNVSNGLAIMSLGMTVGGGVGGYFAGRSLDRRVTHIKIVP